MKDIARSSVPGVAFREVSQDCFCCSCTSFNRAIGINWQSMMKNPTGCAKDTFMPIVNKRLGH
jgi:hypothetical protein